MLQKKKKANIMDAIKNAAGKLVATPMSKGEKREATLPAIPPEPKYEKKSRDGESAGAVLGGNFKGEQHESVFDGSPSMHVFFQAYVPIRHPPDSIRIQIYDDARNRHPPPQRSDARLPTNGS